MARGRVEEDCGSCSHTGHQSGGDGGDCEDMEKRCLMGRLKAKFANTV